MYVYSWYVDYLHTRLNTLCACKLQCFALVGLTNLYCCIFWLILTKLVIARSSKTWQQLRFNHRYIRSYHGLNREGIVWSSLVIGNHRYIYEQEEKSWFTIIVISGISDAAWLAYCLCSYTFIMLLTHPQIFIHISAREFPFQLHFSFTCIQVILAVV